MYRKHQHEQEQKMAESDEHANVVSRVAQLPVVASAASSVTQLYEQAKTSSPILNRALNAAENTVGYAVETAKPVISKLEQPLGVADSLACKALDKLQENIPIISKTPEEIANDTKELYNATIQPTVDHISTATQYGIDQVSNVKEYGTQRATELMQSPYGQVITNSVKKTLNVADQYVDHYLPGEGEQKVSTDDTMMDSVNKLSSKVSQRVRKASINQFDTLQKRTTETLSHLTTVLDLIEKTKSSISSTNQMVKDKLAAAYSKAYDLWLELNKDNPTKDETENKTLEQKSLALSRMLMQKLMSAYNTAAQSVFGLPSTIQNQMTRAHSQTVDLYQQVSTITNLEDVTNSIVTQVQEKSQLIQQTVTTLRDQMQHTEVQKETESAQPSNEIEMSAVTEAVQE